MAQLTLDCLHIIFEELALENDVNSLYSCLLINQSWCEIAIPILWRDPLKFYRNKRNNNNKYFLYNTMISFLPPESRDLLINNDINIFNACSSKPLFNYIKFFKFLDEVDIDIMTTNLLKFHELRKSLLLKYKLDINNLPIDLIKPQQFQSCQIKSRDVELLGKEIYKMIVKELKLRKLFMCNNEVNNLYSFYSSSPEIQEGFNNIVSLECNIYINPEVFYWMSRFCHNIRCLYVVNCFKDNLGLISLIESQKKLQNFTCINHNENFNINSYKGIKGIENSLLKKAGSLISFESYGFIKFYSIFTELNNLKILKLQTVLSSIKYQYSSFSLPKLQQLELEHFPLNTAVEIIQSTKGDLMKIKISEEHEVKKENTSMLIQSITQNCPNLNLATIICYDHNDIKKLKKLFSVCTKLEKLVLIYYDYLNNEVYNDDLLDIIAECAPLSLDSLKVGCFSFSTENLKIFFEKWKMKQQVPLSFYNIISDEEYFWFNNERYNVICKYIDERAVEEFDEIDPNDRFTDWD